MCKALAQVGYRSHQCQLGGEQPVRPLDRPEPMRAHQPVAPVDAVDRIVFRVSGVEEPEHPLEAPGRIRGCGELAAVLLVPSGTAGGVDREPAGHANRFGLAL